jgi:hypothetical protein
MKIDAIKPHDKNPRRISKAAMAKLCESIERDPEFMRLRPIVVDGDGMILGGNQRWRACKKIGMKTLPDDWVVQASDLSEEQRRRFVLVDNAPEGMAGGWDMDVLTAEYGDLVVDLGLIEAPKEQPAEIDLAEDNPKLQAFIAAREKSRDRGKDKSEVNFWLCMVFQSHAQKMEFLGKYPELKTVYGMYCDGEAFAEAIGAPVTPNTQKPVANPIDKELSGMVMP